MDAISPAAAEERPLTQAELDTVLEALLADLEEDLGPPPDELPRRPVPWEQWAALAERLSYRDGFREEDPDPLPCLEAPGPNKLRRLRARFRARQPLFSPRDRQLAGGAGGVGRALTRIADGLAAARHAEASRRGLAIAARIKKRISVVAARACEGGARE
jgi:hypothetical protein